MALAPPNVESRRSRGLRREMMKVSEKRQKMLAAADQEATRRTKPRALNPFEDRTRDMGERAGGKVRSKTVRLVDPAQCRMWEHHNRIYDLLDEESCGDLITSIDSHGQEIPAIVRELVEPEGEVRYEVICGARRHFAVSYLRIEKFRADLLYAVEVRDLTDEAAFRIADLENRDRQDISDFERSKDYAGALERYYGGAKGKMAERLGVSGSWLSRYLALSALPPVVIGAFPDQRSIKVYHAEKLTPAIKRHRETIERRAEQIAKEQLATEHATGSPAYDSARVLKMLLEVAEAPKPPSQRAKSPVTDEKGRVVAKKTVTPRAITLQIPTKKGRIDDLEGLLAALRADLS
jgi:ParB family chromosome partitioning protein